MALRVVLALCALALAVPAHASAAPGTLTGQGCVADFGNDDAGCDVNQQGLATVFDVAVSPDGTSVYAVGQNDSAIVRFDRDLDTGALTPQGCIADVGDGAGCGVTQEGLGQPTGVAVSSDGESVYVSSQGDDALVRFDRDLDTGALTGQGCISDVGLTDCGGTPGTTQHGLSNANGLAVSEDGESVYVVGRGDSAIAIFNRDPDSGAVSGQGCVAEVGLTDCGPGNTEAGLLDAQAVAVSPDGKSVYTVSRNASALVRFDRDTDGALTGQGCIEDVGGALGCGVTQQGLSSARGLAVSADDKSVYVAGSGDDAVARFGRDTTTGAITPQGCIEDAGGSLGCGVSQQGLDGVYGVAASPDDISVYAVSQTDDAIASLDRNPTTGALTGAGCVQEVGLTDCGVTQGGLLGSLRVAVSPDAASVYTAGSFVSAVARFDRGDLVVPPAGKRPTATGVVCNYNFFSQRHNCFAQVADTGPVPPVVPTGTVTFATTEGGSFPSGTSCALASSQTAPAVPSCSAEYIAPNGGLFAQVAATYEGDAQHDKSTGRTAYMTAAFPAGCNVFQGCEGAGVAVKKAIDLVKSLGPFNVGCGSAASTAAFGSIQIPALGKCIARVTGLGTAVQGLKAKVSAGLSAVDFKALFNDLPTLGAGAPKTVGGLFGGKNLGGLLKPVLQNTGIGKIFSQLPDNVIEAPRFQKGLIQEVFKELFKDPVPPFPTPVTGQDSQKKKTRAFVIASGEFGVDSGQTRKVRLKLGKRARRFFNALRRHRVGATFRLRVQATLARGGAPNAASGTKTVRVKLKVKKQKKKR